MSSRIPVAVLALVLCTGMMLAQTPASVTWELTSAAGLTPTTTVGSVVGYPIMGTDTFKIRSYTGTPNGPLGTTNMRWWPTADSATGLSWGLETTENQYRFLRLTVEPAAGNSFTVDSVSFWTAGGGTSGMRLNVYYSTDPTFATRTKLNPGDTAIWLPNSGSITECVRLAFKIGATVPNGGKFYFRIYPYYTGSASTSKYVYTQLAQIKGTTTPSTGVRNQSVLPYETALLQNFPNPFNPSTTIRYSLARSMQVRISVRNILGQEVARVFNGVKSAGVHQVPFQAGHLPSGLYFVHMTAGGISSVRAMHLVK